MQAINERSFVSLRTTLLWGVILMASVVQADTPPPGLSELNVLPKYRMWLEDPSFSELRPDVVTPHTPWATSYAGGRLKLVVIAPRWTQRATVELQQRFDFDAAAIMTFFHHKWADTNGPHYGWLKYGTEEVTTERAMAGLKAARRPDVIVIGWLDSSIIPDNVEQAIIDAVAAGSGLVIINPRTISEKLKTLIEAREPAAEDSLHAVVDGIPTRHLPPMPAAHPRELIGKGAKFYQRQTGGRIVVLDYSPMPTVYSTNCYLSPPGSHESGKGIQDVHYDYYCSLVGRTVLWAGRNMPEIKLTGWNDLRSDINTKDGAAHLGDLLVLPANLPANATVQLRIRDLRSTVEHESQPKISADGRIRLELPQLKSGRHYADVILRDNDGRTLDWGTRFFTSLSGATIAAITTAEKSYAPAQPMPIDVTLQGDLAGAKLSLKVYDTHQRLVWSSETEAQLRNTVTADVSDVSTVQCQAWVTLTRNDTVLAQEILPVLIRQPQPPTDRYEYGAWASNSASFVRRQTAKLLAEHGVRTGILGGDMDDWATFNVMAGPYITRHISLNPGGETGLIVRKPCLTNPQFLASEDKKLREKTEYYKHYSPPAYSLGDDQGMMREPLDGCVSPTCLTAFRGYLAEHYGTLQALNDSWKTQYASFDEAMPLALPDARASGQYPRWVDHRLYMDWLFVETHRDAKAIVRDVDPEARVGFEGPLADNSWIGFEWKQLLDVVDQMAPYPNAWKWDIIRSFARPNLFLGGWYGAYPMYRYPDDRRFYPWYMLFQGANIYYFFSTYGWSEAGDQSIGIAPDLRPMPCLTETTATVNRIQQGIDRLVLGAERQTGDIAVVFSRPSQHAAMITPPVPTRDFDTDPGWTTYLASPDHTWALNTEANLRLLDDMGLSYVFVDHTEIAAGALQDRKFKMLVMPFAHALSAEQTKAIEEFVKAGGTVLADVKPAVFDQHAKLLDQGPLDDVFGIRRTGSAVESLHDEIVTLADLQHLGEVDENVEDDERDPWGVPIDEILQFTAAGVSHDIGERVPMPVDRTVAAADGKPSAVTDAGTPVFITNTYGKGRTCLMNMAMQHYLTLRAAGRNLGMEQILGRFLHEAGIEPEIMARPAGHHTARARIFSFRDGPARIVALLRSHKRLLDEPAAFADRSPRPFIVTLPETGHIYDVINRKYHGHSDRLELQIAVATPVLLAVLPYAVTAISAELSQDNQTVTIKPSVQVADGTPGRHVVYIRITDADGRPRPEYTKDIIANDGRGSHTFNLALNDPAGQWTIALEDIATGTTATATMQIQLP